jgi:hypothetical protein
MLITLLGIPMLDHMKIINKNQKKDLGLGRSWRCGKEGVKKDLELGQS